MNIASFYKSVTQATGPFAVAPAAPVSFPAWLSGPFILGIQVYSSNLLDVVLRILSTPGNQIFPDRSKVMDAARLNPTWEWFHPISTTLLPLRLFVEGGPMGTPEITVELGNKNASTAADVVVNLVVDSKPPDEVTLELLREIPLAFGGLYLIYLLRKPEPGERTARQGP